MTIVNLHDGERTAKTELHNVRLITNHLELLRARRGRQGRFGAVTGPSGCGKTWTARQYVDSTDNVIYYRARRVASAPRQFLFELCEAFSGCCYDNHSANDAFDHLIQLVSARRTEILVIDEAQMLDDQTLDTTRDLFDETKMGVALIGERRLVKRWSAGGRKSDEFEAFRGRIANNVCELQRPSREDIEVLCADIGIEGKRALDVIERKIGLPGGLHNLTDLFIDARALAGEGKAITHRHLVDAELAAGGG